MSLSTGARRIAILIVSVLAGLSAPSRAHAIGLIDVGAGPVGYGTSCLSPNDDGSSDSIDITAAFPGGLNFFGNIYNSIFVNTNGNITFHAAVPQYTPSAFPVADQPMIAPYWADVDIRPSGCGGIGAGTSPGDLGCANPAQNGVWWDVRPGQVTVTWNRVGYYSCQLNHRMNFQLILTTATGCGTSGGVGNFNVEFRFDTCEWETGGASGGTNGFGGTQAQSGFDAGDRMNYVSIPGSRMAGIAAHMCSATNVDGGMPGQWQFNVVGGMVMCPNAGQACNTGMMGVCSAGLTQCVGSGTSCLPAVTPGPQRCNGLDNDCDGMIDNGPCPAGQMCVGGSCTSECVEGSCFDGFTCQNGQCVQTSCIGVTCPTTQRCQDGQCVGACDGITCPTGQVCRGGNCVDPCAGMTCPDMQVCENGVCLPNCGPCRLCNTGFSCATNGQCVSSGCETMTCDSGAVCVGGSCVDPCASAVCPSGETCMNGSCMASAVPDAGNPEPDAGIVTRPDDGISHQPDGSTIGNDGGSMTGGDGSHVGDAAAHGADGGGTHANGNPGCACRTTGAGGERGSLGGAIGSLLLGLTLASRRRRARASN